MKINNNLQIYTNIHTEPIGKAIINLQRDLEKACSKTQEAGDTLVLQKMDIGIERFELCVEENRLILSAEDDLGFVYGIYYISKSILGISEFWFWNDQQIQSHEEYMLPEDYHYQSKDYAVRFRGWFVNDEVLIHTWSVNREKDTPWEMVFEALLRCGGNTVIPGTDKNSEIYRNMASAMGLYITHHHAEPLGAPMFARVYPNLTPSYAEHPEKFQELWRTGLEQQRDYNVIWNLGFRGQGDCPFWNDDPRYATEQARGQLMGDLINLQYQMVKERYPNAYCCTNLYGETMELYRNGYLKLPEEVIKIWADNGFGKMVTRRQENHNPRVYALPLEDDRGQHGIYYHASFYDLQAANHITMLPNSPDFVKKELDNVLLKGVNDLWLINCSNVKPHVYFLDFISKMWCNGVVDVEKHRMEYVATYYGAENEKAVTKMLHKYPEYAVAYGEHEDEHAGEQFSNHVARILVSQYMRNKDQRAEELLWATKKNTLKEQIDWYYLLCQKGHENYGKYLKECDAAFINMQEPGGTLFKDSIGLQVQIHYYCFTGAMNICNALSSAMEQDYQKAFYLTGIARENYLSADNAMRDREHGKWHNFYQNECLADVKQTAWVLKGLMSYLRNLGDGPHFYQWQREFLYSENDRRVMLILNMENHLEDDLILQLMKEKYEK